MGEAKLESEKIIALINKNLKAKKILSAENWHVIFQFNLEGESNPFFIEIKDGKVALSEGVNSKPTLLIVGDGASVARASRGEGDFTHGISREEIEVKSGKIMELIRYGRAINYALRDNK